MQTLGKHEVAKSCTNIYKCIQCDYSTSRKSSFDKHLLTGKHMRVTMVTNCNHMCPCGKTFTCRQHLFRHKKTCEVVNISTAKVAKVAKVAESLPKVSHGHECECGRTYRHASSLSKHKRVCLHGVGVSQSLDNTKVLTALTGLKEDNKILKDDNKTLKEKLNEQAEKLTQLEAGIMTAVSEPKVINNNININIWLNEKCGEAIAIQDFAKTLMICMEDVNYALENGKVKGIENIIQKRFSELGVHKRPLHCTDAKRGTLYVKGEEGWEKEKGEMNKMIRDVEFAQSKGIKLWSDANPDFADGDARLMDKWLRIVHCLTSSIEGGGFKKIAKRCQEMCKIDSESVV